MESVYGARKRGEAAPDLPLADAHVVCGILIFALALARLYLRLVRGAPPPPESERPVLRFAAGATHALLYAIILAMPATGALAWFGDVSTAARLHAMAMPLVAFLVLLHTLAALYHHFVRGNLQPSRRSCRPNGRSRRTPALRFSPPRRREPPTIGCEGSRGRSPACTAFVRVRTSRVNSICRMRSLEHQSQPGAGAGAGHVSGQDGEARLEHGFFGKAVRSSHLEKNP